MNTAKIESLLLLIVVALVIRYLGTQATAYYFLNAIDSESAVGLQTTQFLSAMKYEEAVGKFLSILVNLVIAYWLYTHSTSKRLLWAALGIFAQWWALPLFAYYLFIGQSDEHT
jgi:flagellar basal body-associated protein FliL